MVEGSISTSIFPIIFNKIPYEKLLNESRIRINARSFASNVIEGGAEVHVMILHKICQYHSHRSTSAHLTTTQQGLD